uniref:Uncharacterized protein n=1 Tax=Arion vulgaris TaxID=1028688 RepID=A0A0B7ANJ1_9EUPU
MSPYGSVPVGRDGPLSAESVAQSTNSGNNPRDIMKKLQICLCPDLNPQPQCDRKTT